DLGRERRGRGQRLQLHDAGPRARGRGRRGSRLMARILIIEDEANNLDVARRIVRGAGHEALTATDGLAGLEIARRERPDAVLVDLLLPKLDGWSVTRAIREERWAKGLPITGVSALAMQADRERARGAGCDDFVTKPYAPAELRAVLNRYFADGTAPKGPTKPTDRPGRTAS